MSDVPTPDNSSGDFSDTSTDSSSTAGESSETSGNTAGSAADNQDQRPLSMAERAMQKALKSHGEHSSGEDSISSSEQAESTLNDDKDTQPHQGTDDNTDGTSGPSGDSTPEKSLTPPDSWPEDRRQAFSKLPDDGKALLMSIEKDMERGLKQSFDKLATERKALQENFGLESDQLQTLAERAKHFQTDPTAVISELAEEAGIDVYFQNPEENTQIPEFETQEQLVRWLQQQSRNEARQAAADEAKSLKQQRQQEELKTSMAKEFEEAYQAHPDLADHQDAMQKYILGFNIPVEMAYRLSTWEGLAKLAQSGQSSQAELNKARSELERLQKLSTMPPGRADGRSHGQRANGLDMFEHAYTAAERSKGRQS